MARTCVFGKQSLEPGLCGRTTLRQRVPTHGTAPLLPKLRGQFAEFLHHSSPERLGILYLTTCVGLGYGPRGSSLEAFLGSIGSSTSPGSAPHQVLGIMRYGFTYTSPYTLAPGLPSPGMDYLPASPHRSPTTRSVPSTTTSTQVPTSQQWLASPGSAWARPHGYGNINPLSIDYACRPRLRSRLTQGRQA